MRFRIKLEAPLGDRYRYFRVGSDGAGKRERLTAQELESWLRSSVNGDTGVTVQRWTGPQVNGTFLKEFSKTELGNEDQQWETSSLPAGLHLSERVLNATIFHANLTRACTDGSSGACEVSVPVLGFLEPRFLHPVGTTLKLAGVPLVDRAYFARLRQRPSDAWLLEHEEGPTSRALEEYRGDIPAVQVSALCEASSIWNAVVDSLQAELSHVDAGNQFSLLPKLVPSPGQDVWIARWDVWLFASVTGPEKSFEALLRQLIETQHMKMTNNVAQAADVCPTPAQLLVVSRKLQKDLTDAMQALTLALMAKILDALPPVAKFIGDQVGSLTNGLKTSLDAFTVPPQLDLERLRRLCEQRFANLADSVLANLPLPSGIHTPDFSAMTATLQRAFGEAPRLPHLDFSIPLLAYYFDPKIASLSLTPVLTAVRG
ncbi:MAG: hypothetical protein ACRYFU_17435 [Janthinobacterium lividum]